MCRQHAILALFLCSLFSNVCAFDPNDLQGLWAESTLNKYACNPKNKHQRIALSPDQKTLTITTVSKLSKQSPVVIQLMVTRTDENSVYFRFPGEHVAPSPLAGEFAISIIGVGVYRWYLVSESRNVRSNPIGIRCEP